MRTARRRLLTLLVIPVLAACSSAPAVSQPALSAAASMPSGNIQISAKVLRFEQAAVEIPAGKDFKIDFHNMDSATVHDIDIHRNDPTGDVVFDGSTFSGAALVTYDVPALAAGAYAFVCSVHPDEMRGTMSAK